MAHKILRVGRGEINKDGEINHVPLTHDSISRSHLEVFIDDENNVFITDLDSKNGTYINGNKITGDVMLQKGDILRLGYGPPVQWSKWIDLNPDLIKESTPLKETPPEDDQLMKTTGVVKNKKSKVVFAALAGILLLITAFVVYKIIIVPKYLNPVTGQTVYEVFYDKSSLESKTFADLTELSKSKPNVAMVNGDEIDSKDNKRVKLTVDDSGKLVGVTESRTVVVVEEPDAEPDKKNKDSDDDGFLDNVDKCPNEAGKNNGCPESSNPVPPACAAKGLSYNGGFYYYKASASGDETAAQFVNRVKLTLSSCGFTCNSLDASQIETYNKDKFNVEEGRRKSTLKKGASIKFRCY